MAQRTRPQTMIDTHHHFVPDFYLQALEEAGGDPSGSPVPHWTPEESRESMKRNGARTAILSLTAPGSPIAGNDQAARDLARRSNEYCAGLRNTDPESWGFFAAMPNLLDTKGALDEIAYALDVLQADGVLLFSRYGTGNSYLGHPAFTPVWKELNARHAVVFVHPTHPADTNKVNPRLPQSSIDYPHETTRTAVDMIMSNTKRDHPNCKVILPHAGGNLPWIIPRLYYPIRGVARAQTPTGKTYEEQIEDFKSFYYDIALSSSKQVLSLLLTMVPHDHILYGSDFPYPRLSSVQNFRDDLETFAMDQELRDKIYFKNALSILPRLSKTPTGGSNAI